MAPSVFGLQKLLWACEEELNFLDMQINIKKSVCLRFGNRPKASCAPIMTFGGCEIRWVDSSRYLGVFFTSAQSFRCSFEQSRAKFYKAFNAIYGKVGRFASENVVVHLVVSKCLPVLLYGTEACIILSRDLSSFNFALNRVIMKVFRTTSRVVAEECQAMFGILPICRQIQLRKLVSVEICL